MTTESQIPAVFRRAKRWQLALKIWGLTSLTVGVIGTLALIVIGWVFVGHPLHHVWQVALVAFGVSAGANIPLAMRTLRDYPAPNYWK